MAITAAQIKLIHIAANHAGCNQEQYRTVLRNAGGVSSCKTLTHTAFEDCMAIFEGMGYEDSRGEWYWREVVRQRGHLCSGRMAHKIVELGETCGYPVKSLCMKFSGGRTEHPSKLTPNEAHDLIEAMKDMIIRREGVSTHRIEAVGA
jgi:hypothetical protein